MTLNVERSDCENGREKKRNRSNDITRMIDIEGGKKKNNYKGIRVGIGEQEKKINKI